MSIYDFKVKDINGVEVPISLFRGKVLLIVNTATACGFTPQYDELQDLYEKYAGKGLEILDFPCNQFGNQAPGSDEEIADFCHSNYSVTFRQFSKIEVNGQNEEPLYTYLKEQQGFEGFEKGHPLSEIVEQVVASIDPDYKSNSNIKWNFTKFLVDKSGAVIKRFEPTVSVEAIENVIKSVI